MARSLNRVQLIGNLTRDPELRYTPSGTAVCSFSIATNRSWTTDTGEKHEEVDFHRIVAWSKLAELCSQFLTKGRKIYVEGRLSTRNWTTQDNQQRSTTEVVIDDMILLDNKGGGAPGGNKSQSDGEDMKDEKHVDSHAGAEEAHHEEHTSVKNTSTNEEEVAPDDIPF